jgi:hypothetical protein
MCGFTLTVIQYCSCCGMVVLCTERRGAEGGINRVIYPSVSG